MPKKSPTHKDFVDSITERKEDLWNDETEDADAKHYHPYLINHSLITMKNILLLNDLNMYARLDKKMQYHFLLHSIPKGQTYKTMAKSTAKKRVEKMEKLAKEIKRKEGIGGKHAPLKLSK